MVFIPRSAKVFTVLLALFAGALAHPEEAEEHIPAAELSARQLEANARHVQARDCAPEIAAYNAARKAKRSLERRATTTSSLAPQVTAITNNTCITAPEVTEGPYYIRNELVRQDLRESQGGIPLTLDIGVIDTSTCKPLSNAFVELWAANATGFYGGFTGSSLGGGGGGSSGTSDKFTWLRGGWPTNTNGLVELKTIYPGHYTGRTAHIHLMVHTKYTTSTNGTIVSNSGSLVHIGQLFFEQSLNTQVYATSPYTSASGSITTNAQDSIFAQENSSGNNGIVDIDLLGSTVTAGLYGYITIGVNGNAKYSITTTNYYTGL